MELPICECATEWPGQGHHPECPVRREIERLRAALADATQTAEVAERRAEKTLARSRLRLRRIVTLREERNAERRRADAATERAEAETNRANVAGARLVVARADYGVLLAPARSRLESLLYGEGQDDVPEGLDALLTAAADEIEHSRTLELEATVEREARRCLAEVERERDAANAQADALAARLREVADREHPA